MERSDCTYGAILNKDVLLLSSFQVCRTFDCVAPPGGVNIQESSLLAADAYSPLLPPTSWGLQEKDGSCTKSFMVM